MATYTEYLDFDTEEDKLKQQQLYQATELSAQTVAAVKKDQPSAKLAACRCAILPRLPRVCTVYSKNSGVEPQYPRQLYCPQRF